MSVRGRMNRRKFLGLCAAAAAGAVAAACKAPAPGTTREEPTTAPVIQPTSAPSKPVSFEFWTQDWGPLVAMFEAPAKQYMAEHPNATVTVKQVPYDDLETKLIPSVAAGTEGDGFFSYSNFWQVVDFAKLLLPLTPGVGAREEFEALIYPSCLRALQGADGEIYALPLVSGLDGTYITVNTDQFDQGYDFGKLADGTWEELVAVAKAKTERDASGKMTHAGMEMAHGYWFNVAANWILSQGGSFFDEQEKKWTLQTPEAEWAFQTLSDFYNTEKVCDLEFTTGATSPFPAGMVSMWLEGAYTVSGWAGDNPDLKMTGLVPPRPAKVADSDVRFWNGAIGIASLSRKLANDPAKLEVGGAFIKAIFQPDNLLSLMDVYSGGVPSPGLYQSPDLTKHKYGPLTKDFGTKVWARTVFLSNMASPYQVDTFNGEIERFMRQEIAVKDLLASLDTMANDLETEAQQRRGGS